MHRTHHYTATISSYVPPKNLTNYLAQKDAWKAPSKDLVPQNSLDDLSDKPLRAAQRALQKTERAYTLNQLLKLMDTQNADSDAAWKAKATFFLTRLGWYVSPPNAQERAGKRNLFEFIAQVNTYQATQPSGLKRRPCISKQDCQLAGITLACFLVTLGAAAGTFYAAHALTQVMTTAAYAALGAGLLLALIATQIVVFAAKKIHCSPVNRRFIRPPAGRGTLLERVLDATTARVVTVASAPR